MANRREKLEQLARFLNREYMNYWRKQGKHTSQAEFATWLGVSTTNLSVWMNQQRLPSDENAHQLAKRLGPKIYEILDMPPMMPDIPELVELSKVWPKLSSETRKEIMRLAEEDFAQQSEPVSAESA